MKSPINITEAEWEVMLLVWKQAPVAAASIFAELKERKAWSLATVRTLLRRLVNKGALEQQAEGKRYLYVPRLSIEECVRQASDSFWDKVLGRAPSGAILHLVERTELSREDIKELRQILRQKERLS